MATYKEAFKELQRVLGASYAAGEANAIARLFLESATGLTPTQALGHTGALPPVTAKVIERGTAELAGGRPVQYVLGRTQFGGRSFLVDERALIPRPETEELTDWITADYSAQAAVSILDVGTGSGCIALSLAGNLHGAVVTGIDISLEALSLARENSRRLGIAATFLQNNFLHSNTWNALPAVHVLVSNPPYIPISEKETLEAHVREWEPAAALFVPEADPLLFYRALAAFGSRKLLSGGALYCETHRDYATAVAELFTATGCTGVELKEDIFGAPRMVKGVKG